MEKRTYTAPAGATSITVNGKTYDVDGKGRLQCDDKLAHDVLLSHGYTYGDTAAVPAPTNYTADDLAKMKAALEQRAADLQAEFDKRDAALAERTQELNARAAELDARLADLGARETALTIREAALAATTPPPPPAPPADTKPAKAK